MDNSLINISKFLSYVLRHKPDAIGLALDPEGWASIEELIDKADIPITIEHLNEVVATNDKKRFAISADGDFIRAVQGHSIDVDLGLIAQPPPEFLYHGTATRFLNSIAKTGLCPQNRNYVHLSGDIGTATKVGARHGKPAVLTIFASRMHALGHTFYQAENDVWLTDTVPVSHISGLQNNAV